jgi:DDB1- and CUL4-associated factor 11
MADQSSPPVHGPGSDDVSDDFHPANEWLDGEDEDDDDMDYDPETDLTNPMLFFDADDGEDDDDDEEDDEEEEEEEEDSQDEGAATAGIFRRFSIGYGQMSPLLTI